MPEPDASQGLRASVPAEPTPPVMVRTPEAGEVHLVYQIEGSTDVVPVFELSRTLEALGNVIQEADRVVNHDPHEVLVRVKPFEEGSFVMDLVLAVQNNPTVLFFLSHPEAVERIQKVLEYLGFIKKGTKILASVLELLEFLKNGKPAKVEPTGYGVFNYQNQEGQVMPVNLQVHNLVNNGTIQQFFFPAIGAPLQRESVNAVKTFLANQEQQTAVRVPKEELPAIKAYSEPEPERPREEVVENVTTEFLNPKAGTYGDTDGTWTFTKAGTKRNPIRARITDEKFLARYGRGVIRFYHDDVLKVKLKSVQTFKKGKSSTTNEIIEVFDYHAAPVKRTRKSR